MGLGERITRVFNVLRGFPYITLCFFCPCSFRDQAIFAKLRTEGCIVHTACG